METKGRTTTPYEGSPLTGIFCLKNKQDMKRMEETEDCFILDFDPFDSFDINTLTVSGDKDLEIVHETGQIACRDYPHPRHLCLNFPFESTSHETHCDLCYCYICDKPAPCAQWMSSHCNVSADSMERKLLDLRECHVAEDMFHWQATTESCSYYMQGFAVNLLAAD